MVVKYKVFNFFHMYFEKLAMLNKFLEKHNVVIIPVALRTT